VGGDDVELLARLRAGDESAFAVLVDRYHGPMLRLAAMFVPSRAVAEEVVQDTWLGVFRGVDRFEGRSSLKTWLFRILLNRARTTGRRERRTMLLDDESALDRVRFDAGGHWSTPPVAWTDEIENRLDAAGITERIQAAIDALPGGQREVVVLRDVDGLSSEDVCDLLDITDGNQRVLLHRGRSRIRRVLEQQVGAL
jgi:RNA polymerase sigma-70 factor (ECF subfamily)